MPANSRSFFEAMAAPSARDLSLAQAMRGSMVGFARTKVPKPQSCARDDVLAADDLCVADNALCYQLRVLYEIGRGVNDTWNDGQAIRKMKLLEDDPLMLVSGVWRPQRRAPTLACSATSMISVSGISKWCGPS